MGATQPRTQHIAWRRRRPGRPGATAGSIGAVGKTDLFETFWASGSSEPWKISTSLPGYDLSKLRYATEEIIHLRCEDILETWLAGIGAAMKAR